MYPTVIFFRYDTYSHVDSIFINNKDNLLCDVQIFNNKSCLNKLFNPNNQLLVTFGDKYEEYINDVCSIIPNRIKHRWFHLSAINIDEFNNSVNFCYMDNIVKQKSYLPIFSMFTTCYNSYDKIKRAYNSVKDQTLLDWEWVILDDSPDDAHFVFLKYLFSGDNRIRLYKRSENNGSIGNVKNEVVSLCRGKYVLELDHDDEITPNCLTDAVTVFEKDSEIGFVYMNFTNIYENGANFKYGDYYSLGYAGYYMEKYNNKWVYVSAIANINNVSLSHIVGVPNHPRIWRKDVLMKIGNYNEFLPVSDDYELLLRTAVQTKMAKIQQLGYIQYMNNNNNNFSLIRNSEINRLCKHLTQHCYSAYKMDEVMKAKNAFEERQNQPIWELTDYTPKYCNELINLHHTKDYCIIGLDTLFQHYHEIKELYKNPRNQFFILDNNDISHELLCNTLDRLDFMKMKCYSLKATDKQLSQYFLVMYKSTDEFHIFERTDYPPLPYSINTNTNENTKKITIITPSIRPENLLKIKESINLDYVDEWIIVYDGKKIKENPHMFLSEKIKEYVYSGDGCSGNPQRNFALDHVQNPDTYIYFLDDDNLVHPDLYTIINTLEDNKIYTFNQDRPEDIFPFTNNLKGNKIKLQTIDSAMFLVDFKLCKNVRWNTYKYFSDGIYITEIYSQHKNKWVYIDQTLSYYNKL
jgi:glycosyltransferase involved in cell wall biosynthesis